MTESSGSLPESASGLQRIAIGRTAEVYALPDGRVLKLFHDWMPRGGVERERFAADALARAGGPAPACHGLVEIDGRLGLVFDRVDGGSQLDRLEKGPWRAGTIGRELAHVQARIAAVPADELESGRELLQRRIGEAKAVPADLRAAALAALAGLPDGSAMCHLDLHPDNVLLGPRGPVVIDWLTAARGEPAMDVARTLLLLDVGERPGASLLFRIADRFVRGLFRRAYLAERLRLGDVRRADVDAWLLPVAVGRYWEGIESEWPRLEPLCRRAARAAR